MAEHPFNFTAVVQTFEDGGHLAEALLFPEASCYGDRMPRLRMLLSNQVRRILEELPAVELYRRRRAGTPEVTEVRLTLDPPQSPAAKLKAVDEAGTTVDSGASAPAAWAGPVEVRFHAVLWRHGETIIGPHAALPAHVAFVPALQIEVVALTEAELARLIPLHVRFALLRRRAAGSLRELSRLQRVKRVHLETLSAYVTVKSPKRRAADAASDAESEKPVIGAVGVDLSKQTLAPAWEVDGVVAALADALTGRHPRSVLLVGKSGVGKTAALRELVRRRDRFELSQTPFWATSGSRLVAGMSGFGMWQSRCQRLCSEASKSKAVLCLGNLVELMEVGKSTHNTQGIASFLRPYLARGEVLAVAECTPEQLSVIERIDPHLAEVFFRIDVEEPAAETVKTILLNFALSGGRVDRQGDVPLDEDALETIDRLHRRYATYSALPGRPLRFLRNLLDDRKAERFRSAGEWWTPDPGTLGRREVTAAFARETGLPLFLLDEAVPLDLLAARRWFAGRVIGQEAAADLVTDLIATVKAALNRPRRPIASLLFIGPTGVGKTEMAKALAEFFFGDRERITRFDMSEYVTPAAVERLAGGSFGSEGLLTSKVREQPFAVVLLDEFEKAHPALFDLMLQVLGEGRLTDAAGRVADFSNAIVIMTSNLGAETFSTAAFGLAGGAASPGVGGAGGCGGGSHFVEAVRSFFRPELYNRIDRVVPFEPLSSEVILRIARRELGLIGQRDGLRSRPVGLSIPEQAVGYLSRAGFDVRYGARPLKRAIERELLVPLAEGMNAYSQDLPLTAAVTVVGREGDAGGEALRVTVKAIPSGAAATAERVAPGALAPGVSAADAARRGTELRRDLQRLVRAPVVLALRNDLFELRRLQERLRQRLLRKARLRQRRQGGENARGSVPPPHVGPEIEPRLARLERLAPVSEAVAALEERAVRLESALLLRLYAEQSLDSEPVQPLAASQTIDVSLQETGAGSEPTLRDEASGEAGSEPLGRTDSSSALTTRHASELDAARREWDELLVSIYVLRFPKPDHVVLSVYGADPQLLFELTAAYRTAAAEIGCGTSLYRFECKGPEEKGGKAKFLRYKEEKQEQFLAAPRAEPLGLMLVLSGTNAYARFSPEIGVHAFQREKRVFATCRVDSTDAPSATLLPRLPLDQRKVIDDAGKPRRLYELDKGEARDPEAGEPLRWVGRNWEQAVRQGMESRLKRAVAAMLEEE